MDANQKLALFLDEFNRSVDAKIARIQQAAKEEADAYLAQAESESELLAKRQLATAQKALTAKYRRRLSQNGFQFRMAMLRRRKQMLQQIFAELHHRLAAFAASEAYLPWLLSVLEQNPPQAEETILLRPEDLKQESALRKVCTMPYRFAADDSIVIGGCAILSADGHFCRNHSLDEAYAAVIRNFHREQHLNGGGA